MDAVEQKLFMKPKEFAKMIGATYEMVLTYIHQGMPILPDKTNPFYIIVPSAQEWLKKQLGIKEAI